MFSLFTKQPKPELSVTVNGQSYSTKPTETLLAGAQMAGINLPHSCKVGGCGTCKCKLIRGEVKELTDSSYVLTAKELEQGYILICQSVAKSDLVLQHDSPNSKQPIYDAKVVAQHHLTPHIVELVMKLGGTIPFEAGQHCQLSTPLLPGITRVYSFATEPNNGNTVSFIIKKQPQGVFSSLVHDTNLIGSLFQISHGMGNFTLRSGNAPLMMIASGSGLAPILSILRSGQCIDRPVHLIFAAKTIADLYALDEIKHLAAMWQAPFTFTPILSAERQGDWPGVRGRVECYITRLKLDGFHAYVCGSSRFVDSARRAVSDAGISPCDIFTDAFEMTNESNQGRYLYSDTDNATFKQEAI